MFLICSRPPWPPVTSYRVKFFIPHSRSPLPSHPNLDFPTTPSLQVPCSSASLSAHFPKCFSVISCFSTFAYAILSAWNAAFDSSPAGVIESACLGFGVRQTWVWILALQCIIWTSTLNKYLTSLSLSYLICKKGNKRHLPCRVIVRIN